MTLDELIRELCKLEDRGFGKHEVRMVCYEPVCFYNDGDTAPVDEVTLETPDNRTETAYVRLA